MVSALYRAGFRRGDPLAGLRAVIVNGLRNGGRSSAITGRCACRRRARRPARRRLCLLAAARVVPRRFRGSAIDPR